MLLRVVDPDKLAFQLRKGEEGISVFDSEATTPSLAEEEILATFRPGCRTVSRSLEEIEAHGLVVERVLGTELLPARLRQAHTEIRPGLNMTRSQFKQALKELE